MSVNLQRARIDYALDAVRGWLRSRRKEYAQRAKGLPVELRTQGLMITIASLNNSRQEQLADDLAVWLLEKAPRRTLPPPTRRTGRVSIGLYAACQAAERSGYLAAQAEALALCEHIKRFAAALPEED